MSGYRWSVEVRATPFGRSSELALEIYADVLAAVRADRLIQASVKREGNILDVQGFRLDLSEYSRVWIAGAGKASVAMASALAELVDPFLSGGLLVTKEFDAPEVRGIEVLIGSHPVPDASSLAAGKRMLAFAAERKPSDLVLFVLSGGASALMESLVEDVSLEDLQALNQTLLASGAEIGTVNSIRSRLSRIKGGGLARAFGGATVVTLVLSDVVGNSLATVGSGPLFRPSEVPLSLEILDALPPHVRTEILMRDLSAIVTPTIPHFVIGSTSLVIQAAAEAAIARGLDALPFGDPMTGEAREMARQIVRVAKRRSKLPGRYCLIFGGETTVTLRGKGKGGRCQEMAVAAAPGISLLDQTCFLAAGTDGGDGPTEYAGGIVDEHSASRAGDKGVLVRTTLAQNDSYRFLQASGGHIFTGPTGSNVNDLCLVVRAS